MIYFLVTVIVNLFLQVPDVSFWCLHSVQSSTRTRLVHSFSLVRLYFIHLLIYVQLLDLLAGHHHNIPNVNYRSFLCKDCAKLKYFNIKHFVTIQWRKNMYIHIIHDWESAIITTWNRITIFFVGIQYTAK